jgi:hypothetical protein
VTATASFIGEIEAAAAGRGVTSVIQRLGSWHTRGKLSRVLVFCPYLGVREVFSNTKEHKCHPVFGRVLRKFFSTSMFQVAFHSTSLHANRTSKNISVIRSTSVFQSIFHSTSLRRKQTHTHTNGQNECFGPEKKKCKSSGDGWVSTVKSHRGDNIGGAIAHIGREREGKGKEKGGGRGMGNWEKGEEGGREGVGTERQQKGKGSGLQRAKKGQKEGSTGECRKRSIALTSPFHT